MKSRKLRYPSAVEELLTTLKYKWYTGNRTKYAMFAAFILVVILLPASVIVGSNTKEIVSFFPHAATLPATAGQPCGANECGLQGSCNSGEVCSGTSYGGGACTGVCYLGQGTNCDSTNSNWCVGGTSCKAVSVQPGDSPYNNCMASADLGQSCTPGYTQCKTGACFDSNGNRIYAHNGAASSGTCYLKQDDDCSQNPNMCAPNLTCQNGTCQPGPTATPTPTKTLCNVGFNLTITPNPTTTGSYDVYIKNTDKNAAGSCPSNETYNMSYVPETPNTTIVMPTTFPQSKTNVPINTDYTEPKFITFNTNSIPANTQLKVKITVQAASGGSPQSKEITYTVPTGTPPPTNCVAKPSLTIKSGNSSDADNTYTGSDTTHKFNIDIANNDSGNSGSSCPARQYYLTFTGGDGVTLPSGQVQIKPDPNNPPIPADGKGYLYTQVFSVSVDPTIAKDGVGFHVVAHSIDNAESSDTTDVTYTYVPTASATPTGTPGPCDSQDVTKPCLSVWTTDANHTPTTSFSDGDNLYIGYSIDKEGDLSVSFLDPSDNPVGAPTDLGKKKAGGYYGPWTLDGIPAGAYTLVLTDTATDGTTETASTSFTVTSSGTGTPGDTGTPTDTPPGGDTPTDTPTVGAGTPTDTPTSTPIPIGGTGTPTPTGGGGTGTPTPTGTGPDTKVALTVSLQSIASGVNSGCASVTNCKVNSSPQTRQRDFTVYVYTTDEDPLVDDPLITQTGTLTFNPTNGYYTNNNFDLGNILTTNGQYKILVKTDGFLRKSLGIPNIIVGGTGKDNVLSTATNPPTLFAGDINGDNTLDILDYGILTSCFSTSTGSGGTCDMKNGDFNDKVVPTNPDQADALWSEELSIMLMNFSRQFGD